MQARYYSSGQGRFTSADIPFAGQLKTFPQSWNLYCYTQNNPINFTDPTGRYTCNADGTCVGDKDGEILQGMYWSNNLNLWVTKEEYQGFRDFLRKQALGEEFMWGGPIGPSSMGTVVAQQTQKEVFRRVAGGLGKVLSNLKGRMAKVRGVADKVVQLGTDPVQGYIEEEAKVASKLLQRGHDIFRYRTNEFDWIDLAGEIYDAVGSVKAVHFNFASYTAAIESHLLKQGLNHVVVDLSRLHPLQRESVVAFIKTIPKEKIGSKNFILID
jgi:hypothetical protein